MGNKTINAELYRSALIKTLEEMEKAGDSQTDIADGVRRALRLLDMQPAVDAVEVVRCGKCMFWWSPKGDDAHVCTKPYGLRGIVAEEDFCSYGERKE
jgi:hypothetical protein